MNIKCLFGWTPIGLAPPFISLNQRSDLSYSLTVRGPGINGECGPPVEITIPPDQLAKLSDAIHEHLNP